METKKHEKLAEYFETLPYGTFVSHGQIEAVIEAEYGSREYYQAIRKARALLLPAAKALKTEQKKGYSVMNPNEYAGAAIRLMGIGLRSMEKGRKTLEYAPMNDMTDEERTTHRRIEDRTSQMLASMHGGLTEVKMLERKHPMLQGPAK